MCRHMSRNIRRHIFDVVLGTSLWCWTCCHNEMSHHKNMRAYANLAPPFASASEIAWVCIAWHARPLWSYIHYDKWVCDSSQVCPILHSFGQFTIAACIKPARWWSVGGPLVSTDVSMWLDMVDMSWYELAWADISMDMAWYDLHRIHVACH